jgi:hypothetical protein
MKKAGFAAMLFSIILAVAGTASAQAARFAGHWKNVNPHTKGLVELEITVHGANVDVKALGACDPKPCDVGKTEAHLYAPTVDSNLEQTAKVLTVHYHASFADEMLVVEIRGNELAGQFYTHFTDNSHRTDFVEDGVFRK